MMARVTSTRLCGLILFLSIFPLAVDMIYCPQKNTVIASRCLPSPCTAFSQPSRSIRFSDVSETNGRGTPRQK